MRTSYARQSKKVNASKQTGTGSDDVYKPSLWYYKLFDFFEETSEPSRRGIDTLDDVEEEEVTQNSDSNEPSDSQLTNQHANSTQSLESNQPSSSQPINKDRPKVQATTTRKKQMSIQNKQEKLLDSAQKLLTSSDDWQITGQSIGLQLKDLNKHQLIFVQKIISDAIYYGKLEKLTEQSSISLGNPSAQSRTRYQYSSDSSSVTPIHTPSPQYQLQSALPSPHQYQAQSSIPLQSPQYHTPSPMPSHQGQSYIPPHSPQYHAQSHMPSTPYQAQSSAISFQSTQHQIQACESQCADNSNNNSDMTEFLLFNKDNNK